MLQAPSNCGPILVLGFAVVGLLLGSCTSPATWIEVEIRRLPSIIQTGGVKPDGILAAIDGFKDRRDVQGLREQEPRLWAQDMLFTTRDGEIGALTSEAFAIYLKHKLGWRAWGSKATAAQPEAGADGRISGHIIELGATFHNYGAITTVSVQVQLQVDAMNRSEVEPISINLNAVQTDWFFRATRDKVERLLPLALVDAFDQFSKKTEVVANAVRHKVNQNTSKANASKLPSSTAP